MEDLKKLIKDTYASLPEDLQEAVMNQSLKTRLEDIGRKNNLNESQVQALKNETYFVLLALETISDFQTNLDKQINLGEEIAGKIALSVYDGVFKPVEITLLAIEQIIKEKESEEGIVPEEKNTPKPLEHEIESPTSNASNPPQNKFRNPEQLSSPTMKEMLAPTQIVRTAPKVIDAVPKTIFNNRDAAIEETLKRAKAALEGNERESEKKDDDIESATNDLGDLESEEFKWPGDIAGIEIDNNKPEIEEGGSENNDATEENLNKATILEEIEHPPAYATSPFEEKMKSNTPSIKSPNVPSIKNNPGNEFGKSDPYREPTN